MFKSLCIHHEEEMPEEKFTEFEEAVFMNIYKDYQESLLKRNLVDYSDIIFYTLQIFRKNQMVRT